MSSEKTILSFDFGTKNIGVAVGQTLILTATELPPIKARNGIPCREELTRLVERWSPDFFVVGIPLNMDGSEMEITHRARKFANRLSALFRRNWYAVDERLSTREAKSLAHQQGHKGNYAQVPVDSLAARIILESWMGEPENLVLLNS